MGGKLIPESPLAWDWGTRFTGVVPGINGGFWGEPWFATTAKLTDDINVNAPISNATKVGVWPLPLSVWNDLRWNIKTLTLTWTADYTGGTYEGSGSIDQSLSGTIDLDLGDGIRWMDDEGDTMSRVTDFLPGTYTGTYPGTQAKLTARDDLIFLPPKNETLGAGWPLGDPFPRWGFCHTDRKHVYTDTDTGDKAYQHFYIHFRLELDAGLSSFGIQPQWGNYSGADGPVLTDRNVYLPPVKLTWDCFLLRQGISGVIEDQDGNSILTGSIDPVFASIANASGASLVFPSPINAPSDARPSIPFLRTSVGSSSAPTGSYPDVYMLATANKSYYYQSGTEGANLTAAISVVEKTRWTAAEW